MTTATRFPDVHDLPVHRDARLLGLACRSCGRPEQAPLAYVCPACFGPLDAQYDLDLVSRALDRETIAGRDAGIWRYIELLPVSRRPARGLAVGSTPLISADRLGAALDLDRLWIKDDTRNPSLSFKDRAVAVAAAHATELGLEALACASTGNLAGATAAAAAALGLPAFVFIPADLEPAKVDHALAYGATVVPIEGTYDDVNRLCLEVADETGWGFVNV
ncbi:MAG TPA: pyridoxal-phosphate dependent enzyme, partial [Vitreimonas sp.]|nr:pyridoxal-phosphate dependent enzyme [Vitreimonas sp.]